jgi:hypothetical protein
LAPGVYITNLFIGVVKWVRVNQRTHFPPNVNDFPLPPRACWLYTSGGKRKAESGKRKAESGKRKAESGKQKAESGKRKAESRKRKAESRKRKAESGKQKAESGKRKAKVESGMLWEVCTLIYPDPS